MKRHILIILSAVVLISGLSVILYPKSLVSNKNKVTNDTPSYSFLLPEKWSGRLSNRFDDEPEKGQYGSLLPPEDVDSEEIIFSSALNSEPYTIESFKKLYKNPATIQAKGITGVLGFETENDPGVNTLEATFISDKYMYRFLYNTEKAQTDYKKTSFYDEFIAIARSFRAKE